MRKGLHLRIAGVAGAMAAGVLLCSLPARAAAAVDCSKARNPANCEARQQAMAACQDKSGKAQRQCIEDNLPPRDCSKAKSPPRCEEQQKAREACKGKLGKERNACMREQLRKKNGKAKGAK